MKKHQKVKKKHEKRKKDWENAENASTLGNRW